MSGFTEGFLNIIAILLTVVGNVFQFILGFLLALFALVMLYAAVVAVLSGLVYFGQTNDAIWEYIEQRWGVLSPLWVILPVGLLGGVGGVLGNPLMFFLLPFRTLGLTQLIILVVAISLVVCIIARLGHRLVYRDQDIVKRPWFKRSSPLAALEKKKTWERREKDLKRRYASIFLLFKIAHRLNPIELSLPSPSISEIQDELLREIDILERTNPEALEQIAMGLAKDQLMERIRTDKATAKEVVEKRNWVKEEIMSRTWLKLQD